MSKFENIANSKFESQLLNSPDIVIALLIFFVGLVCFMSASSKLKLSNRESILIYFWHSFFAMIFIILDLGHGFDSVDWYLKRQFKLGISNNFISSISYTLDLLSIGYLGQNALFNIMGGASLLILYSLVKNLNKNNKTFFYKISVLVIFLPGFSLWSSGISKDSISIFGLCLMLFSVSNKEKQWILFSLSAIIFGLARPHLLLFLLSGSLPFLIYYYVSSKLNFILKNILLIFFSSVIILIIYYALFFIPYNGSISLYIDKVLGFGSMLRTTYQDTTLGIQLDTSYLSRIFYFLFKPFPTDVQGIRSVYFALESAVLMILFITFFFGIFSIKKNILFKNMKNSFFIYTFFFSVPFLLLFSYFISNYGISIRQKWMILPFFIIMFNYLLTKKKARLF